MERIQQGRINKIRLRNEAQIIQTGIEQDLIFIFCLDLRKTVFKVTPEDCGKFVEFEIEIGCGIEGFLQTGLYNWQLELDSELQAKGQAKVEEDPRKNSVFTDNTFCENVFE